METKKRPNDETLEPETTTSTHPAPGPLNLNNDNLDYNGQSHVELDNPREEALLNLAPKSNSSLGENTPVVSETNKRLKLTKEADITGAIYSPSMDLRDPSKETTELVEWAEKMDIDSKAKEGVDLGASGVSLSGTGFSARTNHDQEPPVSSVTTDTIMPVISTMLPNPGNDTGKDPALSLGSTEKMLPISEVSGSVMAVASLSEPLLATLDTLDRDLQPDDTKQPSHGPSETNTSASTSHSATVLMSDSQIPASDILNVTPLQQPSTLQPASSSAASIPDPTSQTQPLPEHDEPLSTNNGLKSGLISHQQSNQDILVPALPTDIEMETPEKTNSEDSAMTLSQPVASVTAGAITESSQSDSIGIQKDVGPTIASKEALTTVTQPSPTIQQQTSSIHPSTSQPSPSRLSSEDKNPPITDQLPPLSSLPGTVTSPISQQNARPRSTMSVSALLVSNDDEGGQEPNIGRHISRSIFDQFESPRPGPSHLSPGSNLQKPSNSPSPLASLLQQPSQPPSTTSASQTPQASGQTSNLLSSHTIGGAAAAANARRTPDQTDIPPSNHQGHSGFNRVVNEVGQISTRTQESTILTPGVPRGAIQKEYPADEVMESGGVGGYGNQHHRLASPVGIRPPPESTNGAAGTSHLNGKLPGVGSVTGLPPTHSQDPHSHPSTSYRSDNTHSSIRGRSDSYSPSQHTSMHPTGANGHLHYANTGHSGHAPGSTPNVPPPPLSATSPTSSSHRPCLIVKNDPNLKLEDHPELFLGYYRYDPTLLLPDMQGKENSLLEVRVASSYLTYDNIKVKKRELWGTDIYTDDSDIVAMLIHNGFFIPPMSVNSSDQDSIQPMGQQHNFAPEPIKHICPGYDLAVTLRVLPKLVKYQGSIRHRIKSRTWRTGHDGVSLKIESIRKMCPGEALNRGRSQSKRRMKEYNQERLRVLANIHDETTESVQNERAMRTATFEFTHQGDPCFKYSPELVMDRHDGLSRKWTSWRLKKEVMILENDEERYEISLQHHAGTDARRFDQYRFAVISPRTSLSSWSKATYPLNSSSLSEVLYEDLDWQDFEWVERGVVVQPSQRAKQGITQEDSISLMEGVESTAEPLADTSQTKSPRAIDGTDMEQDDIKDLERDAIRKVRSGLTAGTSPIETLISESSVVKTHDVQQDGVFCVVSRLFWRPITEQRSTTLTSTTPSHHSDNKPIKDAEEISYSKSRAAPGTPSVSGIYTSTRLLHQQNDLISSNDSNLNTNKGNVLTESGTAHSYLPSTNKPSTPSSTQISTNTTRTSTEPGTNTMNPNSAASKDGLVEPRQELAHGPRQEDIRAATLNDKGIEPEEGELEEGEIASE
ncbi:hypothetical protein BGX27_000979 [Mortierella sp. AM989]|nr:hypothetical protein BGX27_000979 [Mortierella sp. AM989]